ncbi:TetR/AcrR family transcriptional regulator [Streptomyces violaceus]|uniref:TetR/AcrR family transcriptional regulator n=1 Tax=Streptomyces violaceus TaxID=1936 RepID=A0ABY9U5K3_STRVL|nr:TetR/AcrR family transcriptional regulator [Streptomyces janthinus]WND17592.1 TetR/AcrR family transcriptional regulator [Streptomyces janthinus]GGS36725.1 TetR family transcriptional regulator [Streptomyces janthinus]
MTGTQTAGRRYGGRDAAQRQQERRTRLIQAGLDLFGTAGYASVSVKQVCSHAGLTERYFYESFRDREDLLAGVYNELISTIRAETAQAAAAAAPDVDAQLRAGLEVFIRTLTGDARKARLVLIEVVGASPRLEVRRREVLHEFAALIAAVVAPLPDPGASSNRLTMTAMSLVGGVNELLVDWTLGHQNATVEELIDLSYTLFIAAYRAISDQP